MDEPREPRVDDDDDLKVEELDAVAGGVDSNGSQCFCNTSCPISSRDPVG